MAAEDGPIGDLVSLAQLDEPAILEALRARFALDLPYTLCGQIVVSVNPFKWLPLYTDDLVRAYHAADNPFAELPPHLYAIVHAAHRRLLAALEAGTPPSQSILVSGESGAGKTEATKIMMRYLASVDAIAGQSFSAATFGAMTANGAVPATSELTERVLQSSPVLEAFGNAQTLRNNNSSRFGKFLKLSYGREGGQASASISSYLLERSRVVRPPAGEANYHVLYSFAGGLDDARRAELDVLSEEGYADALPAGAGRAGRAERVQAWHTTVSALQMVGFGHDEIRALEAMLAAVLALTNLSFSEADDSSGIKAAAPTDATAAFRAAQSVAVPQVELVDALCSRRTILASGEVYVKTLDATQAADAAAALAKAIYGRAFDAIVRRINSLVDAAAANQAAAAAARKHKGRPPVQPPNAGAGAPPAAVPPTGEGGEEAPFIGILDIFGFEAFETNSFEQLCINFANEMLQAQFNADTFRFQQAEYEAEGVPWQHIEFDDNSAIIELLAAKRVGAFSLLDEECRLQTGTASAFVEKLARSRPLDDTLLSVPPLKRAAGGPAFCIRHYAGQVRYDTALFIVKNSDPLHPELSELMIRSACPPLAALFKEEPPPAGSTPDQSGYTGGGARRGGGRGSLYATTVGTRFKEQLGTLMKTIQATHVHYVRCVKPNPSSMPDSFDPPLVTDQLRCAGMLEAIRIARAAYPNRLPCPAFLQLFGAMAPRAAPAADARAAAAAAAAALLPDGGYVVGLTKVFLRPGVMPKLEARRAARRAAAAAALQRASRGLSARVLLSRSRRAAQRLQAAARRWSAVRTARSRLAAVLFINRCSRGRLCRRAHAARRRARAAVAVQTVRRGAAARAKYSTLRAAAVTVQASVRRKSAARRVAAAMAREKVKRSYEGQLAEARERLAAEASEKAQVEAERIRLEQQLREREGATGTLMQQLMQQQAEHAKEVSGLLDIQEAELHSLRAQLSTTQARLAAESEWSATEARKVEQLTLQLNIERAAYVKVQRLLDAERASHAAAKARIKATHSSLPPSDAPSPRGDPATARDALARESAAAARESADVLLGVRAELAAVQAREAQAKNRLAHATAERQREKAKLERALDEFRMRSSAWETEKTEHRRLSQHLQAEVLKRDQWLDKAKSIIAEYQKRAMVMMTSSPVSTPVGLAMSQDKY